MTGTKHTPTQLWVECPKCSGDGRYFEGGIPESQPDLCPDCDGNRYVPYTGDVILTACNAHASNEAKIKELVEAARDVLADYVGIIYDKAYPNPELDQIALKRRSGYVDALRAAIEKAGK